MKSKFNKSLAVLLVGALFMLFPAMRLFADSTEPLNFTAVGGSATVKLTNVGTPYSIYLFYSTDSCATWNTYINNRVISLTVGSRVYFKAGSTNTHFSKDKNNYYNFVMTGTISADGNIMSLLDATMQQTSLPDSAFYCLFRNCSTLTTAPALPATTLSESCYDGMFCNCSSLTTAPALPATTLAKYCYIGMFSNCSSLTTVPDLPATVLADSCCINMFYRCTLLRTAPALPATTLTKYCYKGMFRECSRLTTAPALPATTLANDCYSEMFYGCTALTSAPNLPATTMADYCYSSMFNECSRLVSAPTLPATNLANGCYVFMFYKCSSLKTAPALPATTLANGCYHGMFQGCNSLTTAPALPAYTLDKWCYHGMFEGCTSLKTAPALPATTLIEDCYKEMFKGCTSLKTAPVLPATTLADDCYCNMFSGCISLATAPALPATILTYDCYSYMFSGCTSLKTVPALPATTLIEDCYKEMFKGCSSLIINLNSPGTPWKIPATTAPSSAVQNMFYGTGGTMNYTPTVNTTYYIASDPDIPYTVTAMSNNLSRGTVTGGGQYKLNEVATLTAKPNAGCIFTRWSNGETSDTINITVTGNVTLTAYFETNASTAIDDIDDENAVTLAPNPVNAGATAYIYGDLTDVETVEVLNSVGQVIDSFNPESYPVEVSGISCDGIYFVRLRTTDGKVLIRKLVVK